MYRAAVVGCGVIGGRLADAFDEHEGTRLAAVCDLDPDRADRMAAEHGCTPYTDVRALLASEAIDIVHVGVPPAAHAPIVEAALEAGVNVICEKPIAETGAVGREMVAMAREHDLLTAVNFPFRYTPGFRELVERVGNGEIGEPRRISLRFRFPQWPREWQDVDWLRGREQGGPLREVGSHFLFGTLELFDAVDDVTARATFGGPETCEESIVATFDANGVHGTLDLLRDCPASQENSLTVEGTEGSFAFTGWRTLVANPAGESERVVTDATGTTTLDLLDAFVRELDARAADGDGATAITTDGDGATAVTADGNGATAVTADGNGDLVTFEEALRVQEVVDRLLGLAG